MPVYLVAAPTNPPTEKLVEAANAASARNHVARQIVTATVAKQADLFRIAKAGGDIEAAGSDAPAPVSPEENIGSLPSEEMNAEDAGNDGPGDSEDDAPPAKGDKAK